jgi:hypothetical protein
MTVHAPIISSAGKEGLAPNETQPLEYLRNAASTRQMSAYSPQATNKYNLLTGEANGRKPTEEQKEGEQTSGPKRNVCQLLFQESGQENRTVHREIIEKAGQGKGRAKRSHDREYEGELNMKQTPSLSFDPKHNVSGEGGVEDMSPIDGVSWELIHYPSPSV